MENWKIVSGYKYDTQRGNPGGFYGLSAGWDIKTKRYGPDYAFAPYGDLGNDAHRATLLVRF
ncbi:MAG: hypothetical protein HY547_02995 [Elusimicrobia bacterium]|nr:hypothetical protein [Elusimicrobiota bacterium]